MPLVLTIFFLSLLLGHVGGCGITDEVSQWMENIQNSAVEELPTPMSKDERIPKKRAPVTAPTEDKIIILNADETDKDEEQKTRRTSNSNNTNSSNSSSSKSKQQKTTSSTSSTSSSSSSSTSSQPPKKYANNNSNSNNNNRNNGAMDDFKYPYEKYTKEANYRFPANDDVSDDDDDDNDDEVAAAAAGAGYFYDPETGRRLQPTDRDWHERVHERVRRASGSSGSSARREDNKNTCSLYIQTDPLIWRHIREGIADVSILFRQKNKLKRTNIEMENYCKC